MSIARQCTVVECDRESKAVGLCGRHYVRKWRHGDPNVSMTNQPVRHAKEKPRKSTIDGYETWRSMRRRCYKPNTNSYKYYGARGIKVCDRWNGADGFSNFILDMGAKPSGDYTLDRINVDGDYSPENCKWSDRATQIANKRVYHERGYRVGVSFNDKAGKWHATLIHKGVTVLDRFVDSYGEALLLRVDAEVTHFGKSLI